MLRVNALEVKENGQKYVNALLAGKSKEEELEFWQMIQNGMRAIRENPELQKNYWEYLDKLTTIAAKGKHD